MPSRNRADRHRSEDSAELEHGRGRVERNARRQYRQLAGTGISVEGALELGALQPSRLAGDQRWDQVEEGRVAFPCPAAAELDRQVRTPRIGCVALAQDAA